MKKTFLIILCLAFALQGVLSQEKSYATVYLRNGSIVKGEITESSERMSIKTLNGSIIYFTEKAVKEIIYEERSSVFAEAVGTRGGQVSQSSAYTSGTLKKDVSTEPRNSGYRGFLDVGYTFGMGDYSIGRFELTTSHGYQINPYIFIGGGTGIHYYKPDKIEEYNYSSKETLISIPLFTDFRANFIGQGSFIPFAGLKAGYSIAFFKFSETYEDETISTSETDGLGFYVAPSVGAKIRFNGNKAINLTLGYTFQFADMLDVDFDDYDISLTNTENMGGFSVKVGFEF